MATKPYEVGQLIDDLGAPLTGATVGITSVKTPAGVAIPDHGATVVVDDDDAAAGDYVVVLYDAAVKGEAVITLAITKNGAELTGSNAMRKMLLTAGSDIVDIVNAVLEATLATRNTSDSVGRALKVLRQAALSSEVTGNQQKIYDTNNTTVLETLTLTPNDGPYTKKVPA